MKTNAFVLTILGVSVLATLALSGCKTTAPPSSEGEHAGHTPHVHSDGSVHYH
ncbi:MAG TPA: hypothetical protein P5016_17315 [Verrucomicrobiales bacterium]|nr:hypothetical protein [Verrucomicrobiales bacterium]